VSAALASSKSTFAEARETYARLCGEHPPTADAMVYAQAELDVANRLFLQTHWTVWELKAAMQT